MTTYVHLKYGYDQAGNRLHRLDEVATDLSQNFDERYTYDGLHRLTGFDRGQLDVNGNNLTNATLGQTWGLDPTGNWNSFAQTVTGAFSTTREHNEVNEIEEIDTPTGSPVWFSPPTYDANGNMTEFPQPGAVNGSYTATYDAWNRLVKLENGGTVAEYQYDGLNRRIIKDADSVVRHYYHSDQWQVLEERTGSSTSADRQYLWGERYVDDLILRDHDSTRLYALTDALFNVVALVDEMGDVVERFAYQPYGQSKELDPDFDDYSGTDYEWEYRFTGRELDLESGLQINRYRYLHLQLGRWVTRDPIEYLGGVNMYDSGGRSPTTNNVDPWGTKAAPPSGVEVRKRCDEIHTTNQQEEGIDREAGFAQRGTANKGPLLTDAEKATCDQKIKELFKKDKALEEYFEKFRPPFCPVPQIVCENCRPRGYYTPLPGPGTTGPITLCWNTVCRDPDEKIVATLIHEATHALYNCKYRNQARLECLGRLKTELQANYCSGVCNDYSTCLDRAIRSACVACKGTDYRDQVLALAQDWFEEQLNDQKMCVFEFPKPNK